MAIDNARGRRGLGPFLVHVHERLVDHRRDVEPFACGSCGRNRPSRSSKANVIPIAWSVSFRPNCEVILNRGT